MSGMETPPEFAITLRNVAVGTAPLTISSPTRKVGVPLMLAFEASATSSSISFLCVCALCAK